MVPLIRDMFARFYSYREHWSRALECMSELDVLCSLADYSHEGTKCRPEIYEQQARPFVSIKQMGNPLFESGKSYVPNDI